MQFEQANEKLQQLRSDLTPYKILNAMLNSLSNLHYEGFVQTRQRIINDILAAEDLEALSQQYDDMLLVPMRAKGGRPRSRASSATQRVQDQENESDSSSIKSHKFKSDVRERYI